jgi:hypothetical protein
MPWLQSFIWELHLLLIHLSVLLTSVPFTRHIDVLKPQIVFNMLMEVKGARSEPHERSHASPIVTRVNAATP